MKLSINAEKLKDLVSRSIKGAGNNKLIPLTSLMCIELKDAELTLITTDATNYLYVKEKPVVGDDFYAVVDASMFAKLISKLTSETVTLEILTEGVLSIKGNGTYKIELPLDEDGTYIKYPDPIAQVKLDDSVSNGFVSRAVMQVIMDEVKPALAVTFENPQYTGYYMGDQVVATDTYKIASMDVSLFDEPKLIGPELLDLISVITDEKIAVYVVDGMIVYDTDTCKIVGRFMEGIEDYAIDAISGLVDTEFESSCTIPKNDLIQMLDRLMLFVGPYDKNTVYLTFTKDGLQVSSKAANGVEIIPYVNSDNFKDFTCAIDIQMLMTEVKAIQSDVINMFYGEETAIKFIDGNITILVALSEDE